MCRLSVDYVDRAIVTGWLVQVPNSAKYECSSFSRSLQLQRLLQAGWKGCPIVSAKFFTRSFSYVSASSFCNGGWCVASALISEMMVLIWSLRSDLLTAKCPFYPDFGKAWKPLTWLKSTTPFVTFQHVGRPVLDSWRHSSCKHRHSGQWLKWPSLIDFTTLFLVYLVCASCALSLMRLLSFL